MGFGISRRGDLQDEEDSRWRYKLTFSLLEHSVVSEEIRARRVFNSSFKLEKVYRSPRSGMAEMNEKVEEEVKGSYRECELRVRYLCDTWKGNEVDLIEGMEGVDV